MQVVAEEEVLPLEVLGEQVVEETVKVTLLLLQQAQLIPEVAVVLVTIQESPQEANQAVLV